jgi:hypothetical protein
MQNMSIKLHGTVAVSILTVGVDISDNGQNLHDAWGIYMPIEMLAYSERFIVQNIKLDSMVIYTT